MILFLVTSCTGINLMNGVYRTSNVTHPTPDYSTPAVLLKGGGIIHNERIAGGIGNLTEGELRRGEACSWTILWLVAGGNSSLAQAKKNAGIDFIHFAEYKQEAILGFFFHNFCSIVVGTKKQTGSNREVPKAEQKLDKQGENP
ncbi:TRL domain-containing protein [Leptospira sp. GIMC2001]|uniref:TRL domain-containing protein n=1 Tax=Leptospira sp. GIMC2001 TaxID=1513297 RepID=UPI00234B0C24|nr:TRL domain-containing protein [Leptospira sp. GIMC2001]WCL47760.1 TRL-like family protein [Leptospira sp. GIMC2001]